MMERDKDVKNIALIGLHDTIGVDNVLKYNHFRIIYILEDDEQKVQDLKQKWELEYTIHVPLDEADLMLEDKTVEGVIISQELKMRKKWILKSLKANKCVLCEGIFGPLHEDVQRCLEISQKVEKCVLAIDYQKRYQPFVDIKKQFQATKIVTIIKKITRSKPSVTNIVDALMQDIDVLCWILEEYPEKVIGSAGYRELEQVPTIVVTLKFPKEAIVAVIDINLHEQFCRFHQLEFFGDGKLISGSSQHGGELVKRIGSHVTQKYSYNQTETFQDSYHQILEQFWDIVGGKLNNVEEGIKNVAKCSKIVSTIGESLQKEQFIFIDY